MGERLKSKCGRAPVQSCPAPAEAETKALAEVKSAVTNSSLVLAAVFA